MMLVAARDAGVPLGSRCLWGADALCWSERKHPQGEPCCAPVAAKWRTSLPACFVSDVPPAELPAAASSSWLHSKRYSRAGRTATSYS